MYTQGTGRQAKVNGAPVQTDQILNGVIQSISEEPIKIMKEPSGVPIPVPIHYGHITIKDGKVVVSIVFPNKTSLDAVKALGLKVGDNINADVLPITEPRTPPSQDKKPINERRKNAPRYCWYVHVEIARPQEVSIEA